METLSDNSIPLALPPYTQMLCHYDPGHHALWAYLNPKPRPCFTPVLLTEIRDLQQRLEEFASSDRGRDRIRYLVYSSAIPKIFNLGGDFDLFARVIGQRNHKALYEYGRICVEAIYANAVSLNADVTTIVLVQGSALGGGFEGVLSCNLIVAEEDAQMGFPEIGFNLFPGMGALSLLSRRIHFAQAERLISTGQIHNGRALWEQGIVNELAAAGEGVQTVNRCIRDHRRFSNGHLGIKRAVQRINPLSYGELIDVVEIWVDSAMRLTARDLRMMGRLVTAQTRLNRPVSTVLPMHGNSLENLAMVAQA